MTTATATSFWERCLQRVDAESWSVITEHILPECERLRPEGEKAARRGTMSPASCALLFGLVARLLPAVTVEVGTFIGTSTRVLSMRSLHVYTCDDRHDLLTSDGHITTYPMQTSTQMLSALVNKAVKADLFFFDGRLQDVDIPLVLALSTRKAVYAFDDYEGNEKGAWNVTKLQPYLPGYVVVPPPDRVLDLPSRTTIAALVPKGWA